MAEENKATFQEIIGLKVSVDEFRKSLEAAYEEWAKFKKKLGSDASAAIEGTGANTAAASLNKVVAQLQTLVEATTATQSTLSQVIVKTAKDVNKAQEESTAKQVADTKKANKEKVLDYQKTVDQIERINAKLTKLVARNVNAGANSLGDFSANDQKWFNVYQRKLELLKQVRREIELAREIEGEQNKVEDDTVNDWIKSEERREKQARKFLKERAEEDKRYLNSAQEMQMEHERTLYDTKKERFEYEYWWRTQLDRQDAEAARKEAQRQKDLDKRTNEAVKRELELKKQRERELALTQAQAQQREAALQRLSETAKRIANANQNLDLVGISSTEQRVERLRKRIQVLRSELATINVPTVTGTTSAEGVNTAVAAARRRAGILEEILRLENRINSERQRGTRQLQSQDTFVAGLFRNLASSVGMAFRLSAAFALAGAAINAVTTALLAPFKAILIGMEYLRETEKEAASLVGVLAQTVKFSEDFVTNMKMAKEASIQMTQEMQNRSAAAGLDPDAFKRNVSGFLNAGVMKYTQNLKEVIDLTEIWQLSFVAAGKGLLSIGESAGEINKALNGVLSSESPFLTTLKISSAEWEKIRKESEAHRDLIPRLTERFKPFRDAIILAGRSQAVLLNNAELLAKRFAGLSSGIFFEKLNQALIWLRQQLDKYGERVANVIKLIAKSAYDLAAVVAEGIGNIYGLFGAGNLILGSLLVTVQAAILGTTALARTLGLAVGILKDFSTTPWGSAAFGKKFQERIDNYKKETRDSVESFSDLIDLLTGKKTPDKLDDSLLKRMFGMGTAANDIKSEMSVIKSAWDAVLQQYEDRINQIESYYSREREGLKRNLDANLITIAEYTNRIKTLAKQQNEEIFAVVYPGSGKSIDQIADDTRAQIAGQVSSGVPADQVTKELQDFDKKFSSWRIKYDEYFKKNVDLMDDAESQLTKHFIEMTKERLRQEFQTLEQSENAQLAFIKSGYDKRFQLLSDRLQKEMEVADKIYNAKKKLLTDPLMLKDLSEKDKFVLGFETERLDIEYIARRKNLEAQIKRAQVEENARVVESERVLRQERLKQFELLTEISRLQNPSNVFDIRDVNILGEKEKELSLLREEINLRLEISRLFGENTEETIELQKQLTELDTRRLELYREELDRRVAGIDNAIIGRITTRQVLSEQRDRARSEYEAAVAARNAYQAPKDSFGFAVRDQRVKTLDDAVLRTRDALIKFNLALQSGAPTFKTTMRTVADTIFGTGFLQAWKKAGETGNEFGQKIGLLAGTTANVVGRIQNVMAAWTSGKEQGGILGGIGGVAQQFGDIPIVGPYAQAFGQIMSFVGGIFTARARKLAENIRKDFEKTLQGYRDGNSTLVNTISAVEKARTDAILRLSGTKGGKTELNKLLPEFDEQIKQLKKEQQQILENFEVQLQSLQLQDETLSGAVNQWREINKQVKEYIGAGGDAAKAAEFLSRNLEKIRTDAAIALDEAESEALQQAIRVNDLLKQRIALTEDFKKREFDLINASALERRRAGSIERGRELAELRKQYEEQLNNLNDQISLENRKLDKQKEFFDLTKDIADLRRRDEELALQALDRQLDKVRSLREILSSITQLPNGSFTGGGIFNIGSVPISVTVNGVSGNPEDIGRDIADGIMAEWTTRMRMVPQP